MKITSKGEYAAQAVLYLAIKHPVVVPIQEIAERHNIPLKYLEHILLTLKNAGILRSRRGIKGGYQLNREPARITVGEVLHAVDGNFAQSACVEVSSGAGGGYSDVHAYGLKSLWDEVQSAVEKILNQTTFDDIRRRSMAAMQARSEYIHFEI